MIGLTGKLCGKGRECMMCVWGGGKLMSGIKSMYVDNSAYVRVKRGESK